MNEKLFEMLEERLTRMEGKMDEKLDKLLEHKDNHATRLTHLESQAGFIKWGLGALGTLALAVFSWALKKVSP